MRQQIWNERMREVGIDPNHPQAMVMYRRFVRVRATNKWRQKREEQPETPLAPLKESEVMILRERLIEFRPIDYVAADLGMTNEEVRRVSRRAMLKILRIIDEHKILAGAFDVLGKAIEARKVANDNGKLRETA
jgi:hypothetical protein